MAILINPRNPPTSWLDDDLDWSTPDPSNPLYLACILEACRERVGVVMATYPYPYLNTTIAAEFSGHHYSLRYGVKEEIQACIKTLMTRFLVASPDAWPAHAPYIPMYDNMKLWVGAGTVFGNSYTGYTYLGDRDTGVLVAGKATQAWLKACRFILDKCVIIASPLSWYCTYVEAFRPPPAGADAWDEHWAGMIDDSDTTNDYFVGRPNSEYSVYSGGRFFTRGGRLWGCENLRYIPNHRLNGTPHKLITYFADLPTQPAASIYCPPGSVNCHQLVHWDSSGYGFLPGRNERVIPQGSSAVSFGSSSIVKPAAFPPWDNEEWNGDYRSADETNTFYTSSVDYEFMDFTGCFKFKGSGEAAPEGAF